MTPAIEVRGLSKTYLQGSGVLEFLRGRKPVTVHALQGVDLSVAQGEVFALLGPNGAGKTTLLKILCSLVLPNGGEAKVGGYDVVTAERQAKELLSLVIGEERSFYWRLTGRQNLEFFAALYNLSPSQGARKIREAASILGFPKDALDKRYQEYSTGMKQRLALARSFLNDARIIFMDEPTRSLDPAASARLRGLIKDFARAGGGRTVFFTTHDTREAEDLADRIGILDRGRLKVVGTLEELRTRFSAPGADLEEIFLKATEGD